MLIELNGYIVFFLLLIIADIHNMATTDILEGEIIGLAKKHKQFVFYCFT